MASLGSKAVGSIVKLNVNGAAKNFIVVHQGLPGTMYDSSCDGTWLLMEDIYEARVWDSTDNDYANSDIHSYLNNTFVNLFDSGIKGVIKQVKLPYIKGAGASGELTTGSSGLSAKVFLLSRVEVGFSVSSAKDEGSVLSYFNGAANSKRVAKLDGSDTAWWLRSPYTTTINQNRVYRVGTSGADSNIGVTYRFGVRPALVVPSTLNVDSNGNVSVNTAPGKPGVPSFSNPEAGKALSVSWSAASDADGNLSGYILEVQLNGGSWTQVYKGSAQTYSYTVPDSTNTIAFRVKAYDTDGAESSYATSATAEVSSGGISGALNINGVVYELTGEGYVNIGGVLCDIVDSSVNIGGTLNSMKG